MTETKQGNLKQKSSQDKEVKPFIEKKENFIF